MSAPPVPAARPGDDLFRYGWRYVRHRNPDGTEELEQVPLTLLDVLHPEEDDQIVENTRHERLRRHFQNVFERRLARRAEWISLSDCRIDWDREDLRAHGPDLIVLERDEPWPWASWGTVHVRREGARPLLAVEIVSPHTRDNDVVIKVEHYYRAGVPLYLIVDQQCEEGPLSLIAYERGVAEYLPLEPDGRGWIVLAPFGIAVAAIADRVALYDAETGEELGDYLAVCEALAAEVRAREAAERRAVEEAEARAEAERQAAEQTQARAEAERRALEEAQARAEAERQAAEQTQARAEAERRALEEAQARAEAERREHEVTLARAAVEARLKELEAELARLRGPAA